MIEAENAYQIYQDEHYRTTGTRVPNWAVLSWRERDKWQAVADEINAKDRDSA